MEEGGGGGYLLEWLCHKKVQYQKQLYNVSFSAKGQRFYWCFFGNPGYSIKHCHTSSFQAPCSSISKTTAPHLSIRIETCILCCLECRYESIVCIYSLTKDSIYIFTGSLNVHITRKQPLNVWSQWFNHGMCIIQ